MTIRLKLLAISGPGKETAAVDFAGKSHLVFGPTDTGKSYIVECLRYCLGSDERPRDIGFSEGYNLAALQVVTQDDKEYTLFRELTLGDQAIYSGFHIQPPQNGAEPLTNDIGQLIISWAQATDLKILAKSGVLNNLAAGDIRYVSLFDEIETLDKVPLEGKDKLFKMRNKSAISLILSGVDDSQAVLVPSTAQKNVAKGHVEALDEEIRNIKADIPDELTKSAAEDALLRVTNEIGQLNSFFQTHTKELTALKQKRAEIEKANKKLLQKIAALSEAQSRFRLLEEKYDSDLQRLQAISTAASVINSFEVRACPLCHTDIDHQERHNDGAEDQLNLQQATQAESVKIDILRKGLVLALRDVESDLNEARKSLLAGQEAENQNLNMQDSLLAKAPPNLEQGLTELTERKSILAMAVRDLEKIERLEGRLKNMRARAKRQKQLVERDISQSATSLCKRIKSLLDVWGVPGVESIYFDDAVADITINQRQRVSFGKGKRGIFLAAYVVALMEQAISSKNPHLGIIAIDSPVVTYKDPKHGSQDPNEALDVGVKDRFYAWLADRREPGQVIVLENEEPEEQLKKRLSFTEFVGAGEADGRTGLFPTRKIARA